MGATGTGKSALAVKLARRFSGEIVSADSRQVYRRLDVGTGKITRREMRGIPHHLLDVASLRRTYTAKRYARDARHAIQGIWRRGKLPVLCGGTGLYVNAVVDGTVFPEVPPNPGLRASLGKKSAEELYRMLRRKDPRRAQEIDRHNPRRLVRALEIAEALGKVPETKSHPLDARALFIGLRLPKREFVRRTRARIRSWLRRGLLREVETVPPKRLPELGLVYRAAARLAKREVTRGAFVEDLTRDLLRYAKRQETWFTRDARIRWAANERDALRLAGKFLKP